MYLLHYSQNIVQTIKGIVSDRETGAPLPGANISILNSGPLTGTIADSNGKFSIVTATGRVSVKISYLGYEDLLLKEVLVTSGREVNISAALQEKVIETGEVVIRPGKKGLPYISQMAAVSTNTIRTEDALHYAGGFYDPSRIVNAFAGVATANSDESNDLIIRGNSPRGLLWRLEGVEIPNPNHFSSGMGEAEAHSVLSLQMLLTILISLQAPSLLNMEMPFQE
ncbi:MAG: carboxypeptidase-like regulatory domain-containing protein [Marinilabiliales bacterium]|nr:carboxypeptidase-like regulatory domain-containing protein [Marinilabiliales bacterium]